MKERYFDIILKDILNDEYRLSEHAREFRMGERAINANDIFNIAMTYKERYYHSKHKSYNFIGHTENGRLATIACKYCNGTTIITLFLGR